MNNLNKEQTNRLSAESKFSTKNKKTNFSCNTLKESKKFNILFLCTGNSCRSQMAEGWTNHLKKDVIQAFSAGIEAQGLNPLAVKVMAEAGVDISQQQSKSINLYKNHKMDIVITVCGHAHETCPVFPSDCKVIHVGFDDPPKMAEKLEKLGASPEEQLQCYRQIRDEIKDFIQTLPEALNK